ncbi:hypothetical protein C3E98_027100 [Pseudomonas sp. MWU13-2625]|nr:hypothetical protein C3E98_027100 [Pseudomonas sp. MWU13-2625]
MWRGSLLPLGCAAVVNPRCRAASQPGGSKLPRHKGNPQPAAKTQTPPAHIPVVHGKFALLRSINARARASRIKTIKAGS